MGPGFFLAECYLKTNLITKQKKGKFCEHMLRQCRKPLLILFTDHPAVQLLKK